MRRAVEITGFAIIAAALHVVAATLILAQSAPSGDAVWPLLAAVPGPVELRADAHMPAADVVRVLGRLRGLGGPAAYLVVTED
ncbi:hypothetical protein [Paracoccus sp. (in: a-proteobacteria)]|uniref:hypothetical protein n=1 Tax=Paracoccus sp. TaxID=267 RepID=UPI0026DFFEE7|nr:hypothetical protein [Paracoccus sp. (in: a-proteobacteria)]MDO5647160.1 hypothetical protein [Paracoccus sp. (in: a-proteobacteria)]